MPINLPSSTGLVSTPTLSGWGELNPSSVTCDNSSSAPSCQGQAITTMVLKTGPDQPVQPVQSRTRPKSDLVLTKNRNTKKKTRDNHFDRLNKKSGRLTGFLTSCLMQKCGF